MLCASVDSAVTARPVGTSENAYNLVFLISLPRRWLFFLRSSECARAWYT